MAQVLTHGTGSPECRNGTQSRVTSGLLSMIASVGKHFSGSIPTDKNLLIEDLSEPSVALEINDLGLASSKADILRSAIVNV